VRQSNLFTKIRREAPKDEAAKNAQLLIRAGFIHKELAGVYSFLPLGWRVLNKINEIVRREMNGLGATELHLTGLQNPAPWQASGRWSDQAVDFWFKTKLKNKNVIALAATHEEPLVSLMRDHLHSYRDLPLSVYQIQTKFRNETRVKSGLLRCREFLMKDLYSFHHNQEEFELFYDKVRSAYENIFQTVGLGGRTYQTFASGGTFSRYSHEFQTVCEAGEDTIYLSERKGIAVNAEIINDEMLRQFGLEKEELVPHRAIEVGNLFNLGQRFSEALDLSYLNETGDKRFVWMGSYGLGTSRLLGTIVEVLADEKGLVWPRPVAPFLVHLVALGGQNPEVKKFAEKLYEQLERVELEVLFDDRDLTAGEQFAESDLIGLPYRVVVSEKALASGRFEIVSRVDGGIESLSLDEVVRFLQKRHV
jgi:prolyl-tRNA synthetase